MTSTWFLLVVCILFAACRGNEPEECSEATSFIQVTEEVWVKQARRSQGRLEATTFSAEPLSAKGLWHDDWPRLKEWLHRHPKNSLAQLLAYIPELAAPPKIPSHPFPSFEWSAVKFPSVLICVAALFAAGVLCSAGGIGGGGVYVTVLMVAGQLSPHDAVPLSKAVVFAGSLSSLALNLRKSLAVDPTTGGPAKTLIDYNICRLVVPSALFGTLMGVLLNSQIAPWLIVAMLASVLIFMTWMSSKEFWKHYIQECSSEGGDDGGAVEALEAPSAPAALQKLTTSKKIEQSASIRNVLCSGEGSGAFALLLLVISCGVLRAHAIACGEDLARDKNDLYGRDACMRPIIHMLLNKNLLTWMTPQSASSEILNIGTVLVPMVICLSIVIGYSCFLVCREGWTASQVILYSLMAVTTGCFAGLVGIGGGLVFSPFILWMTSDPTVAVATSSTCVIFTSSSTTFQYLFTDRITMSLTVIYGIVNLVASYMGTSLVHKLDTSSSRKTLISGIVCLGVIASVILSVYKLCTMGVTAH